MAVKERGVESTSKIYSINSLDSEVNEILENKKDRFEYKSGKIKSESEDRDVLDMTMPGFEVTPLTEKKYVSPEDLSERTKGIETSLMNEQRKAYKEDRRKARKLTARRVFETCISIGLIVLVGVFVMLLLYPQTELSELSKDNSDAKDRIVVLKNQVLDAQENANGVTDMDSIRAQALMLGMQDPNSNQVVNLPVPSNDKLKTVVSYDAYGVSEEALNNAMDNLSEYYRTHPGA